MELCQALSHDLIFLSTVSTGDERWIYGNDPEKKQLSSQAHQARKRCDKLRAKSRASSFIFDLMGIVHK